MAALGQRTLLRASVDRPQPAPTVAWNTDPLPGPGPGAVVDDPQALTGTAAPNEDGVVRSDAEGAKFLLRTSAPDHGTWRWPCRRSALGRSRRACAAASRLRSSLPRPAGRWTRSCGTPSPSWPSAPSSPSRRSPSRSAVPAAVRPCSSRPMRRSTTRAARRTATTLDWDAWRREDGKWIVTATYSDRGGAHTAQWSYDHGGRNIHPLDDEARLLMGARPVAVPDPEVDIAEALDLVADIPVVREDSAEVRPHLVAVPDADDEADEAADQTSVEHRRSSRSRRRPRTPTRPSPSSSPSCPAPRARPRPASRRHRARAARACPAGTRSCSGLPSPTTSHGPKGSGCADMCWRCDRAAVVRDR